jgi:predicted ATPase/DNA-binding SARP family transcriptional activator
MSQLALYLLGPPSVAIDGQEIRISRRKALALLAYLAVTDQSHTRDALATLFWPEQDQTRARNSLRSALVSLRKALGEGWLETDRENVGRSYDPEPRHHPEPAGRGDPSTSSAQAPSKSSGRGLWLDVAGFRNQLAECQTHGHPPDEVCPACLPLLARGAELYRGDFMTGFTLPDSPAFDEWQYYQSEGLRDELAGTLERLAHGHTTQGEYAPAIAYARRWVSLDALNEPAHRLLMQLYAWSGQRAAAMEQYAECERVLAEELDVPPTAETAALYERILAGEQEIPTPRVKTIRGYELRERIGSGGFGEVYRAYQPSVAREVAVKVILPQYANHPEFVRRFQAEAQLVARLEHPHIVPLYDYWHDAQAGGAYLVMRWLPGGNLHEALQRGPWRPEVAAQLLDQITGALDAAHRQGVVHRDVKPENILLDRDGNAYLSDFGIAKDLTDAAAATDPEAVPGSLWYISPEQAQSHAVTAQSDLYSLGIVMHQVLTGEHPFSGLTPPDQLIKRLTEPLPPLRERQPDLPEAVEEVIGRATAHDPGERYPGVAAFAQAFRAALSGIAEAAASPSPTQKHNLPAQLTPFVGREREIAEIKRLLGTTRLLTLTGPPGTGKTRLALQVAAEVLDQFADGVFFVDLAPISDPGLVASTTAQVFGVRETAEQPLLKTLKIYLREKRLLLLLDNFEQIIDAAPFVGDLLSAAPGVKALVTSREALRVYGEQEYTVPPLTLPDLEHIEPLRLLSQYEAVELFAQRARAVKPDFALTEKDARAVAEICVRLDGLPLAIELAAARSKLFAPQMMLQRLESQLGALTGGPRDLPARQRTLRGAIDWSYDLLDPTEKTLFARLAVFQGGRSVEAVEAVCSHGLAIDVLEGLESLLNKSLLGQDVGLNGEPRFVMLEMIHEYARERLEASGQAEDIRRRHAEYFLALAERAAPELRGAAHFYWLLRFRGEHNNLRMALAWSLGGGDAELGLRLAGALRDFWYYGGHSAEGLAWTKRALESVKDAPPDVRARVLHAAGALAFDQGDHEKGKVYSREALALYRVLGDELGRAQAVTYLSAHALASPGECREGIALCEEALALFRNLDDKPGIAMSLNLLGELARLDGDYERAGRAYQEVIDIAREEGLKLVEAISRANLTYVAYHRGDYEQAEALALEGLRLTLDLENTHYIPLDLAMLAGPVAAQGKPEKAARLLGASEALLEKMGLVLQAGDKFEAERYEAAVRKQLDAAVFAAAWAKGRAMSLDEAVAYALGEDIN